MLEIVLGCKQKLVIRVPSEVYGATSCVGNEHVCNKFLISLHSSISLLFPGFLFFFFGQLFIVHAKYITWKQCLQSQF